MGAWLIELISNLIDITGNPIADTVIFAVIGLISGSIAFGLTGFISNTTRTYNSKSMSDLHWSIRVVLFVLLTLAIIKVVEFIKWFFTPPTLYYSIGVIILIIVVFILLKIFRKPDNKEIDKLVKDKKENHKNEENVTENVVIKDLRKCPYCGGLLVEREGPYGKFLGCSNFPVCKYTRNE
jgi:magnesium-transporting ATPase (P-type)